MSQSPETDSHASERPLLIQALREVLAQGLDLAEGVEPAIFSAPPEGLANSGVGPHLRHALDFCRRFVEGLETGQIDYDRRERDPREETDPAFAADCVRSVMVRLEACRTFDPTTAVDVRHDVPAGLIGHDDPNDALWTRSTLGRELLFVLSHTIHHYALMAMSLRHHGVEPGPDFGVAPSTLRYWAEEGATVGAPVAAGG